MAVHSVKIDLYERLWLWVATTMIVAFLVIIIVASVSHAVHPPSHVETIDPTKVRTETEFAEPGVYAQDDGSTLVVMVAAMYSFDPATVVVPAGRPVRFRITSVDVIHGFQIVGTNANATVVPGYVTEFELKLPRSGEFLVLCNEYCGLQHHAMQGRLLVREGDS